MKNSTLITLLLILSIITNPSSAATFTAAVSGSWSSSTTWGGGGSPAFNLSSDQVIIPNGINVTLDSSLHINGVLASVLLNGTLSTNVQTDSIQLGYGDISGNGTITAGALVLDSASLLTFTGNINANYVITSSASIQLAANLAVTNSLILNEGILTIGASGNLHLSSGATIEVRGGALVNSGGLLGLGSSYNVTYSGTSATAGPELNGNGLNNININLQDSMGSVTLVNSLTVSGVLSLNMGSLTLNGHNLTITGNLNGASGSITSTSASNININTATSPSGHLRFTQNGNTVGNFTVNINGFGGAVMLDSNLIVQGTVNFMNGSINTGNAMVTLLPGATITGASSSSYFITGDSGRLAMNLTAGGSYKVYPVGTLNYYSPASIQLNAGSASGTFMVHAMDSVRQQGDSGNVFSSGQNFVNTTWLITSQVNSNIDLNLRLAWSASMEGQDFNRDSAYISHYTSGNWDTYQYGMAASQSGGMYYAERTNITSLSPFTVFSYRTATAISKIENDAIQMWPNPILNNLHLTSNVEGLKMELMDLQGNVLNNYTLGLSTDIAFDNYAKGSYFIKITDGNKAYINRIVHL